MDRDLDTSGEDDLRQIERMVRSVLDGSVPRVTVPEMTFGRAPDPFSELESA